MDRTSLEYKTALIQDLSKEVGVTSQVQPSKRTEFVHTAPLPKLFRNVKSNNNNNNSNFPMVVV